MKTDASWATLVSSIELVLSLTDAPFEEEEQAVLKLLTSKIFLA